MSQSYVPRASIIDIPSRAGPSDYSLSDSDQNFCLMWGPSLPWFPSSLPKARVILTRILSVGKEKSRVAQAGLLKKDLHEGLWQAVGRGSRWCTGCGGFDVRCR